MPDSQPTIGEPLKAKMIASEDVDVAVDAFLSDPSLDHYKLADDVVIDPAAAVRQHKQSAAALADEASTEAFRRTMVRTAIVLARAKA